MTPQEFARLVDHYGPPLILYARQWCHAPEDVVQDAFLKLMKCRSQPKEIVPWLYRVVRNAALDVGKSERRRQRRENAVASENQWFVEPQIEGLDAKLAIDALQHLAFEQREVIIARLWGGLSFEEIAAVADCSVSTAFRRFQSGLEMLRKQLGVTCPND